MPIDEILREGRGLSYGENEGLQNLVAADYLSLPGVLPSLNENEPIKFELEIAGGVRESVQLTVGSAPESSWARLTPSSLWASHPNKTLWWETVAEQNLVYVQIDKIDAGDDRPIAVFMADAVSEAERAGAKLVIDLRWNTGGSADYNRAITLAIAQSKEINQFARCFVIFGPRTFSAAQMLLNDLERYTRATFVGAPTGAMPDHFGDPRKLQLKKSGLTLRVSELHWSGWIARDVRTATAPLIDAPLTRSALLTSHDPALTAITAFNTEQTVVDLFGLALEREDHYAAYRYIFGHATAPDTGQEDISKEIVTLGKRYETEGKTDLANFVYRYGIAFYPDKENIKLALDALSNG
jgi:hypothetical protein